MSVAMIFSLHRSETAGKLRTITLGVNGLGLFRGDLHPV